MSPVNRTCHTIKQMLSLSRLRDAHAVLFDVDGTLVDSMGFIVPGLRDMYQEFGGEVPSDAELLSVIGLPLRQQATMFGLAPASDEEIDARVRFAMERYRHYQSEETLFEPAVETLRLCFSSGIPTALVTSKNADELKAFLSRFPAADAVNATVCATDVLYPKPDPESARLACQRLDAAPERTVFIGDSIYDLRCARDAGCIAIAVSYGSTPKPMLESEAPDALFETPGALLAWAQQGLLFERCPEKRFQPQNLQPSRT